MHIIYDPSTKVNAALQIVSNGRPNPRETGRRRREPSRRPKAARGRCPGRRTAPIRRAVVKAPVIGKREEATRLRRSGARPGQRRRMPPHCRSCMQGLFACRIGGAVSPVRMPLFQRCAHPAGCNGQRRANKSDKERVRPVRPRAELRVELRGEIERVAGELDDFA